MAYSIAAKRYALYEKKGKRTSQSSIRRLMELASCFRRKNPRRLGNKTFRCGSMKRWDYIFRDDLQLEKNTIYGWICRK